VAGLTTDTAGPLGGTRVLELPAVGPVPFAAMLLADLCADVVRVDRCPTIDTPAAGAVAAVFDGTDHVGRSRRRIAVDLKRPDGVEVVLGLADGADVLLEGFRPGVAERLGVGPDVVLGRNPALVYGRLTGWGQDGPLAGEVGHEPWTGSAPSSPAPSRRSGSPGTTRTPCSPSSGSSQHSRSVGGPDRDKSSTPPSSTPCC
jgi:alpha-methylacyl-CoA racemase